MSAYIPSFFDESLASDTFHVCRTLLHPPEFLVDKSGKVYERYAPTTKPSAMAADIEKLLNQPSPA